MCIRDRPEGAHAAAALGAARLAWLADGGTEQEVCQPLPTAQAFAPEPGLRELLAERYPRYRALYPALRDFF